MKGVSELIEALMLIVITMLIVIIIVNWSNNLSEKQSESVQTSTSEQLACTRGGFYIKNVTYNCSSSCASGISHLLNMTVVNTGEIKLYFNKIYLINTKGKSYDLNLNDTMNLSVGQSKQFINYSTSSCTDINNSIQNIVLGSSSCGTISDTFPGSSVTYISC